MNCEFKYWVYIEKLHMGGEILNDFVCIVGGANIDITGTSFFLLNPNDSNPGKITTSLGGVGRNIAENLSRMGIHVEFITTLGGDYYSRDIEKSCERLNISLKYSQKAAEKSTSTYLCINDKHGEMQLAISDMEIYNNITPGFLESRLYIISDDPMPLCLLAVMIRLGIKEV